MGSCLRKLITSIGILFIVSACGGGTSSNSSGAPDPAPDPTPTPTPGGFAVSGSIGDGPIVGAAIVVRDADGNTILETISDATARYSIDIPEGTSLPVTVTATGGTDLVTGREPDFELAAAILATGDQTTNVAPMTTLAVRGAQCAGGVDTASLERIQTFIDNTLSMGLDGDIDPSDVDVGPANAAQIVLASEALGEVVRRAVTGLTNAGETIDGDAVLNQVACDLAADGSLDGSGPDVAARTIATFRAAESAVLFEILAGQLHVDGADATALMDMAISAVLGQAGVSVANVAPTTQLVDQARAVLRLFQANFDDQQLVDVLLMMQGDDPVAIAAAVTQGFNADNQTLLSGLSERVALADDSTINDISTRMANQESAVPPQVSLSALPSEIDPGDAASLTWSTTNADRCFAAGGWSGEVDLDGTNSTGALTQTTGFDLTCTGLGGTTEATVSVTVTGTDPAPTVQISVNDASIDSGDVVIVSWASENATQCIASGGWTGVRATTGTQQQGPLTQDQIFTLECSGPGGSATASATVAVAAPAPTPTVALSAEPSLVDFGGASTLSWTSTNATLCVASDGWLGSRAPLGTESTGALDQATTFVITCTGAGGTASDSVTVNVSAAPTPSVSLSATPDAVSQGGSSTLSWTTTNASSCSASNGWSGSRSQQGSETINGLTETTTFTLTCTGPGGTATASAIVAVDAPPAPTVSITAADSSVASGTATTLSWSTTNATSCSASNGWSGTKPVQGSESTGPLDQTATFVLTCTGAGGSASASVTVNLAAPTAPIVALSATLNTVDYDASTTLSWATSNADSCSATDGWSGSRPLEGAESTGSLTQSTTFILTCSGAGGTSSDAVTVNVRPAPAPTVSISAADNNIDPGTATSLTWSSTNTTDCSASGGWSGSRALAGTESTGALQQSTTFTINCSGAGGTASDSVTVDVSALPAPTVSISAADSTVDFGGTTTLSWSSTNATACTASGGWSGSQALSGTDTTGTLQQATTFVINCTGSGGSVSDSVTVNVVAPPSPTVDLTATASSIDFGDSTSLNWSSTNATACTASNGWTGSRGSQGTESTGALQQTTTFVLTCTGSGGSATDSVTVTVAGAPAPSVTLTPTDTLLTNGASTTLNWSSSNADSCTASGDWSGSRSTSGSESTGALQASASFSLTCTGTGGSAVAIVSVGVQQTVTVTWDAPTENDDGTPLVDLDSFNLYVGQSSGSYDPPIGIPGSGQLSHELELDPGVYYLVVRAVNTAGDESNNSNEVAITVQ